MKLLLINIIFFHFLFAYDYKLEPKSIGNETHCFFGVNDVMDERNNGNISNSCFVNMGTSYLVIDSGPTYLYAQQAYEQMKKIEDLPISYVVNTHAHDDHWLGNSYYSEIGVKIIGSQKFTQEVKLEKTRMQTRISKEAYKNTKQIFPSIYVETQESLTLDAKKIYIQSVHNKAHSDSDLFVYIPKYSIVFAGDLVFSKRIPSIRDGNLENWITSLDKLKSMDMKYIVGGHGNIVGIDAVNSTYKYLNQLLEEVSLALDDGVEIDQSVNKITLDDFKDFEMYGALHKQNVEIAYRMLEWGE